MMAASGSTGRLLVGARAGAVGAWRVPSRWYVGYRLLLLAAVCHLLAVPGRCPGLVGCG
jgi:hypothetical protein